METLTAPAESPKTGDSGLLSFRVQQIKTPDSLSGTKKKMTETWMANDCRLAWLIDSRNQTIHIFRENGEIQIISGFDKPLSGETGLPGFTLKMD